MNLIGGITPITLRKLVESDIIGTGLGSRILFIYGARPRFSEPFPELPSVTIPNALKEDLEEMYLLNGEFIKSEEYIEAYIEWYNHFHKQENYQIKDKRFHPYCLRRLSLHLPKLACIVSASRSNDMIVKVEDFERALGMLTEMEHLMPQAFGGAGALGIIGTAMYEVQDTIMSLGKVRYSKLIESYQHDLLEGQLWEIILTLKKMGECELVPLVAKDREGIRAELKLLSAKELSYYFCKNNYQNRDEALDWLVKVV